MLDFALLAISNLLHKKTRTYLTLLGIFIGIASVIALYGLGQGLREGIVSQADSIGADKLYVRPKAAGFGIPDSRSGQNLTDYDLEKIRQIVGVKEAGGMIFGSAKIEFKQNARYYFVYSIPEDKSREMVIKASLFEIESGRMLRKGEILKAVVGSDYTKNKVLGRNLNIGDTILINKVPFDIVGVLKKNGDPSNDGGVILNENVARPLLSSIGKYDFITVQVEGDPLQVASKINRVIRKNHDVDEGKEDFSVETPDELIASFDSVLGIVQAVVMGIAAISLLVGGVGIMNTMYTSVLERTKEIGIMKAIGASPNTIMTIFLIEAGLLGFIGGLIGVILGYGLSKLIEFGSAKALGQNLLKVHLPIEIILGALLFAFIIGAVSGTLPAIRASKLQPVTALRS